jgi:phosphoglycerate dehydrogenase-like enzyme
MEARVTGIARSATPGEVRMGIPVFPPNALDDLLARSDAVVLCLPLTGETRGLIDAQRLSLMRRRAVLVNVGRGALVDEEALYEALSGGTIAGAGIDVWYNYPQSPDARASTRPSTMPFEGLPNVVMSPHRGGAMNVRELEERRILKLAELINAAVQGREVPHRVDPRLGY